MIEVKINGKMIIIVENKTVIKFINVDLAWNYDHKVEITIWVGYMVARTKYLKSETRGK